MFGSCSNTRTSSGKHDSNSDSNKNRNQLQKTVAVPIKTQMTEAGKLAVTGTDCNSGVANNKRTNNRSSITCSSNEDESNGDNHEIAVRTSSKMQGQ